MEENKNITNNNTEELQTPVNEIPIEILFKYAIKERNNALKEVKYLKREVRRLENKVNELLRKIPARVDGSLVSQSNYEKMANERNKAIEDRDLFISRLYAKEQEIKVLKEQSVK